MSFALLSWFVSLTDPPTHISFQVPFFSDAFALSNGNTENDLGLMDEFLNSAVVILTALVSNIFPLICIAVFYWFIMAYLFSPMSFISL